MSWRDIIKTSRGKKMHPIVDRTLTQVRTAMLTTNIREMIVDERTKLNEERSAQKMGTRSTSRPVSMRVIPNINRLSQYMKLHPNMVRTYDSRRRSLWRWRD